MNMIEIFQDYMDQRGIRYIYGSNASLEWYISSDCRLGILRYVLQDTPDGYILYIYIPVKANMTAQTEMLKIAEFVTRINFSLRNGHFELDWNTGELSFRYPLTASGAELDTDFIDSVIHHTLTVINSYGDAFLSILFGNAEVKSCVEDCFVPASEPVAFREEESDADDDDDDDDIPPDWGTENSSLDDDTNEAELYDDTESAEENPDDDDALY